MRPLVLSLGVVFGLLLAPLAASANAPAPPDWCYRAGDSCELDGKPAVCVKEKCAHSTPNGTADGDCYKCVPKTPEKPKDKPKK